MLAWDKVAYLYIHAPQSVFLQNSITGIKYNTLASHVSLQIRV